MTTNKLEPREPPRNLMPDVFAVVGRIIINWATIEERSYTLVDDIETRIRISHLRNSTTGSVRSQEGYYTSPERKVEARFRLARKVLFHLQGKSETYDEFCKLTARALELVKVRNSLAHSRLRQLASFEQGYPGVELFNREKHFAASEAVRAIWPIKIGDQAQQQKIAAAKRKVSEEARKRFTLEHLESVADEIENLHWRLESLTALIPVPDKEVLPLPAIEPELSDRQLLKRFASALSITGWTEIGEKFDAVRIASSLHAVLSSEQKLRHEKTVGYRR